MSETSAVAARSTHELEEEFFSGLISLSSVRRSDVHQDIDWSQPVAADVPWMPFEFTTLFHAPEWNTLSPGQKIRLTQLETLNIFSMTLAGEAEIKREITGHTASQNRQQALYLELFVQEEANHTQMFHKLFALLGKEPYRYIHVKFPGTISREFEKLNAFAQTLVAEEVLTYFNAQIMKSVAPALIKAVHRRHHSDEVRHIAMGRTMVRALWDVARSNTTPSALEAYRKHLREYCFFFCHDLFNATIYKEVGLAEPRTLKNRLQNTAVSEQFAPARRALQFIDALS